MKKHVLLVYIISMSALACNKPCKIQSIEKPESTLRADSITITNHLTQITKNKTYRNYQNISRLNETADFILSVFDEYADTAYLQSYKFGELTYHNVVCRFGKSDKPVIVVGAHYDVCGDQEGADDNASGVVGLLELARLLKSAELEHPIELVAYSLEEPPFFRSSYMGSYIHAQSLNEKGIPVYGMICLEMIGFFDDQKGSQQYPVKSMKVVYGTQGDFILLAKRGGAGSFVNRFSSAFNQVAELPVKNITAPAKLQGLDFSDHLNYWNFKYDALMVTNTAFYRNKNYHRPTDTMETLDIPKMAMVIDAVFQSLLTVSKEEQRTTYKGMKKI